MRLAGPTSLSPWSMRVAYRHFLLDSEGTLYRLPRAALDRMLHNPARHCLPRFAGQRVRSAEVAVEMMNGRPVQVVAIRVQHVDVQE
jgi:hypothetical protein